MFDHEYGVKRKITAASEAEAEIDDRVYRLYGLPKDEIKLVEESASAKATA
jgi:hypothetical protein